MVSRLLIALRAALWCGLAILLAANAITWIASDSVIGDAFSHFQLHYAALAFASCLVCTLLSRRLALAALLTGMVSTASATIYPFAPISAPDGGPTLRVMTINVLYRRGNEKPVIDAVRAARPDVVLLQEYRPWMRRIERDLRTLYPHQLTCHGVRARCGLAILSRHPFEARGITGRRTRDGQVAWIRLGQALGGVTIGTVHLRWPLVSDQARQLDVAANALAHAAQGGPILLGGDFNAAPWSGVLQRFARDYRLLPAGSYRPTWPARDFRSGQRCRLCIPHLQIDHLFVSAGLKVTRRKVGRDVGSDHLPLIVDVELTKI
ncbi:MAG: endonuclease/exonuclease/phosphatase family protein [Pseudomonadota bacterium]